MVYHIYIYVIVSTIHYHVQQVIQITTPSLLQMIQDIPETFNDDEEEFEVDIGVEIRLRADSMEEKDEIKEVVTTL